MPASSHPGILLLKLYWALMYCRYSMFIMYYYPISQFRKQAQGDGVTSRRSQSALFQSCKPGSDWPSCRVFSLKDRACLLVRSLLRSSVDLKPEWQRGSVSVSPGKVLTLGEEAALSSYWSSGPQWRQLRSSVLGILWTHSENSGWWLIPLHLWLRISSQAQGEITSLERPKSLLSWG